MKRSTDSRPQKKASKKVKPMTAAEAISKAAAGGLKLRKKADGSYIGVKVTPGGRWKVECIIDGVRTQVGYYATVEEGAYAAAVFRGSGRKLHPSDSLAMDEDDEIVKQVNSEVNADLAPKAAVTKLLDASWRGHDSEVGELAAGMKLLSDQDSVWGRFELTIFAHDGTEMVNTTGKNFKWHDHFTFPPGYHSEKAPQMPMCDPNSFSGMVERTHILLFEFEKGFDVKRTTYAQRKAIVNCCGEISMTTRAKSSGGLVAGMAWQFKITAVNVRGMKPGSVLKLGKT